MSRKAAPEPVRLAHSLLSALEGVCRDIDVSLPAGVPHPDAVRERRHAGLPALTGEPLIDGGGLQRNLLRFLARLSQRDDEVGRRAAALMDGVAAHRDPIPWDELAAMALAGEWDELDNLVGALQIDAAAFATLLDWAVRPALIAAADRVSGLLGEPSRETGRCPGCGALPGLAELRGTNDESARVLRCLRCTTAWRWPRLACPSCGERDHERLGYLHAEGELEFRRVEHCDSCRFYVKAVATLSLLAGEELLGRDLDTAGLDVVAAERGLWRAP